MRAVIRCHTAATKEEFRVLLEQTSWWAALDQEHADVVTARDAILDLVAPADRNVLEETYWFMLHRFNMRTWGLVCNPQHNMIEIRLRNESSMVLRKAAELLVMELEAFSMRHRHGEDSVRFSFPYPIEVLEANSPHFAYFGEPLPTTRSGKLKLAKDDRRQEFYLGIGLLVAAIGFTLMTTPSAEAYWPSSMARDSLEWWEGFWGRLSTSFLASGFVAMASVALHYFDLAREGAVRWSLHPNEGMVAMFGAP